MGDLPQAVKLGDVDNDGDLDSAAALLHNAYLACTRFNDGTGSFSGTDLMLLNGNGATGLALADLMPITNWMCSLLPTRPPPFAPTSTMVAAASATTARLP